METVKECQLCGFRTSSMAFLLKHLTAVHSGRPGFHFSCGLNGCLRTFGNITTYKHHVYAAHSKYHTNLTSEDFTYMSSQEVEGESGTDGTDGSADGEVGSNNDSAAVGNDCGQSHDTPQAGPSIFEELKVAAATWILKIKEKHKIPQSAIKAIIDDVTVLFQTHLSHLFEAIKMQLKSLNVEDTVVSLLSPFHTGFSNHFDDIKAQLKSLDVVNTVLSLLSPYFDSNSDYGQPFRELETEHHQQKFFKKKFSMIEPQTIVLGTERKMKGSGRKRRCVEVRHEMKYIPLLSTIERLLQSKELINEVETGHQSHDLTLRDYCDGQHFGTHPLGTITSQWLQIFLYFDELELCNPLGSRRTIHKIGAFYFTLGNCSPKLRSKLRSIQLLALVKNSFIKKYGIDSVLRPIVDDLKLLENGVEFKVSGSSKLMYGTVCVVSADNPASCLLGGFKESSSAHLPCRQCLGTRAQIKSEFRPSKFDLRTSDSHEEQLQALEDPNEDYNFHSKEYGLNRRSLLSELKYFDVVGGALIPDIMHDVLEGLLQYEAKLMLRQFIYEDHYFTLDQLNQLIEAFELGYSEVKSRPSLISQTSLDDGGNLLKQSASQMWLLGRLLPLMIGSWIPRDNEHWLLYLLLLDIVDILFAPDVTEEDIALLSVLILDHHNDFVRLYPNASVIPKIHFIIHMARLMRLYGPLRHHWTMRYESKHSYFKRLANSLGNYINICHTLSFRHEQLQCFLRLNDSSYSLDVEIGPGKVVSKPSGFPVDLPSVYSAKWVEVCGTTYKKPSILVVGHDEDYPVFGRLTGVYTLSDTNIIFGVQVLHTHSFDTHFHSYRVSNTSTTKFISYDDLVSFAPLHERELCGHILVSMKYRLATSS